MSTTSYTITVENRTAQRDQSYVIFSQPPQVTGSVQGRIWPVVISRINVSTSQKGRFKIMSKYYQAFCGVAEKSLANGTEVIANSMRAISLGDKKIDGTRAPGTTLTMAMGPMDVPEFPRTAPAPNAGVSAFEVVSGTDFTSEDAQHDHYLLGYGVYTKPTPRASPAACFLPEPGTKYTIKPSHSYYIASGNFEAGTIINPDTLAPESVCKVDFTALKDGAFSVEVVHSDNGDMYVRGSPP